MFVVSTSICLAIVVITLTRLVPLERYKDLFFWVLIANFLPIFLVVFLQYSNTFRPLKADTRQASPLTRQFAKLFSLIAILPVVFVAVFLGASFNRGMENWFSTQVSAVIEQSASISQSNQDAVADDIRLDIGVMAIDLNRAYLGFKNEPEVFERFLLEQASFRNFTGAVIINAEGNILASSDSVVRRVYEPPSSDMLFTASSGDVSVQLSNETSRFWALYKLVDFEDGFLYTVRPINPILLDSLVGSQTALENYRAAEKLSQSLQLILLLGFVQLTALILVMFVRIGVLLADDIAGPILILADAADKVRQGDLTVHLDVPPDNNEVAELTSTFNNMTAQLKAQTAELERREEEALERRNFTETVLENVRSGVVRTDNGLRLTLTNSVARNAFRKMSSNDCQNLRDVSQQLADVAQTAIDTESSVSEALVMTFSDGVQKHYLVRAEPIDEVFSDVVLTFDDTTDLVTSQRQLAWRDVARRVAHEIRNPLTPIQLSAERLGRKYRKLIPEDDTVFERCLDTITRQVDDIGRMIGEFTSFARMPKPEVTKFDFIDLCERKVFDARLAMPDISYDLVFEERPVFLTGDERLLGQVFTNILKNAGEALNSGGMSGKDRKSVCTTIRQTTTHITIEIEDNGPGFPTEERHKILEPYVTSRDEGIGLGMAIVNRIILDHDGQLTLMDRRDGDKGARVDIRLPISGPRSRHSEDKQSSEETLI